MIAKLKDLLRLSGGEWLVSFTTRENPGKLFDQFKDAEISVEMKKRNPKRSLDANALCWALCADIGKALRPPVDKEEVYRMAIRAVGVYTPVMVVQWHLDTVRERWSTHGVGWFVDVVDDAGIGRKMIHLYYGTSTYTRDEMRLVLDWLTDQAEQMGLPLRMSKEEEERILTQWGKASSKRTNPAISAAG